MRRPRQGAAVRRKLCPSDRTTKTGSRASSRVLSTAAQGSLRKFGLADYLSSGWVIAVHPTSLNTKVALSAEPIGAGQVDDQRLSCLPIARPLFLVPASPQ